MVTGGGLRTLHTVVLGLRAHRSRWPIARRWGSRRAADRSRKGDGKLTFDKLTDLYHSGTKHEKRRSAGAFDHSGHDQCALREGIWQRTLLRPANVYELVDDASQPNGKRISLNPSNCVHCKTCDIQNLPLPDHHVGATGRRRGPAIDGM